MVYVILVILGLSAGSFVNALVWRLHEQSLPKKKRIATDSDLSIVKGRSMCVHCGHTLSSQDLIPLLSWLTLGGKCRYCKKPISWQYPVVELAAAVLFVVSYIFWPTAQGLTLWSSSSLQLGVWLIATIVGMALAVYDFKWMELPDRLVKILALLGLVYAIIRLSDSSNYFLSTWYLILAVFVSGGLFYILYQISDRLIGGGDVKLGLALGLFLLTPVNAGLMLFGASLSGTIYAGILVILGKYKKGVHIPFGPFLLLATYLVVLFGKSLIHYYEKLILIS